MSVTRDEWYRNPDAPFYDLLATVSAYLHPEVMPDDELFEMVEDSKRVHIEWVVRFKDDLRKALLDPSKLPKGALSRAAGYSDGNDIRFLRRLWRDLYPNEPVPGGDDEFREHLRKLITGEVEHRPLPETLLFYDDNPGVAATVDELQALGRRIWQRFYPDEPLPT